MYGTIEDAIVYVPAHYLECSAWTDATTDEQTAALNLATEIIDCLMYTGEKTATDQENEFPRDGKLTVPEAIEKACYDIAFQIISGADPDLDSLVQPIVGGSLAGGHVSYDPAAATAAQLNGVPSQRAWNKLTPFLVDPSVLNLVRVS